MDTDNGVGMLEWGLAAEVGGRLDGGKTGTPVLASTIKYLKKKKPR